MEVIRGFCFEDDEEGDEDASATPIQICVPEDFFKQHAGDDGKATYGQLFKYLLNFDILAIGLYKNRYDQTTKENVQKKKTFGSGQSWGKFGANRVEALKAGATHKLATGDFPDTPGLDGSKQTDWYVYTSPDKQSAVRKHDLVFVMVRDIKKTMEICRVPLGKRPNKFPTISLFASNVGEKLGFDEGYIDANVAMHDHMKTGFENLLGKIADLETKLESVITASSIPPPENSSTKAVEGPPSLTSTPVRTKKVIKVKRKPSMSKTNSTDSESQVE